MLSCGCGRCRAVVASQLYGGVRWVTARPDRWFDLRRGTVTRDTVQLVEMPTDQDGVAQCPHCRDLLHPSGRVTPEQQQLQLVGLEG